MANRLVQPMKDLTGSYYSSSWPGYKFKEALGYTSGRHTGVDYNGGSGGNTDLGYGAYAIGTGRIVKKVTDAKSPRGFGNVMIYELTDKDLLKRMGMEGKRVYIRYMHLSKFLANVGDTVRIGQRIAEVGNSGTVYAHLHADMWHNGNGLGAHMDYHKDSQLASYLDIYKTVEKYKTAPPAPVKPAPAPKPAPIEPKPVEPKPTPPSYEELMEEIKKVREKQEATEAVVKENNGILKKIFALASKIASIFNFGGK